MKDFINPQIVGVISGLSTAQMTVTNRFSHTLIYKIDGEALEISEVVLAEREAGKQEEKARILAPNVDDITYGIRQYTGNIVIAGFSDDFKDEDTLVTLEENKDFEYVVIGKSKRLNDILKQYHYKQIAETETYHIWKKAEG